MYNNQRLVVSDVSRQSSGISNHLGLETQDQGSKGNTKTKTVIKTKTNKVKIVLRLPPANTIVVLTTTRDISVLQLQRFVTILFSTMHKLSCSLTYLYISLIN